MKNTCNDTPSCDITEYGLCEVSVSNTSSMIHSLSTNILHDCNST